MVKKNRIQKKKEMTITLKSKPLKSDQVSSIRLKSYQKSKQRDFRKKGPLLE